jgi:hypothetical protein
VRELQRQHDAVGRHPAEAIGEVAEQEQQAVLDAGLLPGDELHEQAVVLELGLQEQRRHQARPAARAEEEVVVEHRHHGGHRGGPGLGGRERRSLQ